MIPCGVTEVGKVSVPLIFTDRIRAAGATPVNEMPGTGAAAMMLATAVPWPTQSAPGGMPGLVPATRSGPGITRSPNCGFASTPLSTTATVTPAPLVRFQTEEKPSSCCGHGAAAGAAIPAAPGSQAAARAGPRRRTSRGRLGAERPHRGRRSAGARPRRPRGPAPHVVPHPPPPPPAYISICTALTPARLTMAEIVTG